MSRTILLPILGLAAIILYGTTQAARPSADEVARIQVDTPAETQPPRRAAPPPPPAPRLRSEIEAEAAARADSIRRAQQRATDTIALGPNGTQNGVFDTRTVPLREDSAGGGRIPAQPPNTPIP